MPMKNERNVHGFNEGLSWVEMTWVTMSRSSWRTIELVPVIDSKSFVEWGAFSACFSLETDGSNAKGDCDITTVEKASEGQVNNRNSKVPYKPPSPRVRRPELGIEDQNRARAIVYFWVGLRGDNISGITDTRTSRLIR